ncbi:MAG: hypothetical protein RL213_1227 [Bacteroidota bacterium]|jgi:predicted O-methyltransferase YrrM
MGTWTRLVAFVRYRFSSSSPHGVHSPFIFDFQNDVLLDTTPFYRFEPLHALRAKLALDRRRIRITDLGAGSGKGTVRERSVRDIVQRSSLPEKYARLLFRAVHYFRAKNILEIGTSLGLTTLHLALPDPEAKVVTLEGCPATAAVTRENFSRFRADNIRLIEGEFSETLPVATASLKKIDFAFLDGNHRLAPTLSYFEQLLPYCHAETVLVFDDIHWSREMETAWKKIIAHQRVTLSVDLYRLGFVFFREGVVKQHFTLKS